LLSGLSATDRRVMAHTERITYRIWSIILSETLSVLLADWNKETLSGKVVGVLGLIQYGNQYPCQVKYYNNYIFYAIFI